MSESDELKLLKEKVEELDQAVALLLSIIEERIDGVDPKKLKARLNN